MTDVRSISLLGCEKEDSTGDPEINRVGTLLENDLDDDGDETEVHRICRTLITKIWEEKEYENEQRANARKHSFTELDSEVVQLLNKLQNDVDTEENAARLAELFVEQTEMVPNEIAVLDLLIISHFRRGDEDFVAIIKTPYIDDAHDVDPDTEDYLIENEQVIREQIDKSVIYPRYDPIDEEIDVSKALLFQKRGSTNWAKYWYQFLDLKENKYPDEEAAEEFRTRATEGDTDAAYDSYTDFRESALEADEPEHVDSEDFGKGSVSISIAGQNLKIPLDELGPEGRARLARSQDDAEYYLVLSDSAIDLTPGASGQDNDLLGTLEDLPLINDLI